MKARQTELEGILNDSEAFPHHPDSLVWWRNFKDHSVLPYPGSWLEQPAWFLDDCRYFDLLDEYHNLPYWITKAQESLNEAGKAIVNGPR